MKANLVSAVGCAALVLAGCAGTEGTQTHRLRVELAGTDKAECVSPQAIGALSIEAPGDLYVEPEAPNVEVICNAEGFQETYARFEEVYNDGSAEDMAVGALAFGLIGLAVYASKDSVDSLPDRVTITMIPEGDVYGGPLAIADYSNASEILLPVSHLSPPYTEAEPPEGSELAEARAEAAAKLVSDEQAQRADLLKFEKRLTASKDQLTEALDRYNKEAEFKTSSHQPGTLLGIKDVSRVSVVSRRKEGYVVRIVGNSGAYGLWSYEVYDELFLIEDRRANYRIRDHGRQLAASG